MKQKATLIILSLVCALLCAFGLVACGNRNEPIEPTHNHNYIWVDNGDGTHKQHCQNSDCDTPDINIGNHDYRTNDICICGKAKPSEVHTHSAVLVPANPATCTENGNIEYYACDCGKLFSDKNAQIEIADIDTVINKLGHDYSSEFTTDKQATCTEGGSKSKHCSRCDSKDDVKEIAALGHDIVNHNGQLATCTEKGWNIYETCSRCDYTTYSEIPALGHNFIDNICDVCGAKEFTDGLEYKLCENESNEYYEVVGLGNVVDKDIRIPKIYNGLPVTSIGYQAFYNCSRLTSITIPNSVTSIGSYAFSDCSSLTSITIPNGVTSIGGSAFKNCRGLTSISVASGNTKYHSNGNCIIETASKTLIVGCKNSIIPSDGSVTSIGSWAFYNCEGLTSISIPNSVTSIGNSAFNSCSGLTSISIPNSVTSIGSWAFYNCSNLTNIGIPNSVTSIDEYAFFDCKGLTSIEIPNSVTSIGHRAFFGCNNIKTANIPAIAAKYIRNNALKFVVITGGTSIENESFSDCKYLTNIEIPNSVTSIGDRAFYNCESLTSITIPNSVTSIGSWAFYNCEGLTSITIPNSVTSIGDRAFNRCSGLTSITVASGNTNYHSNGNCLIETTNKTLFAGCKYSIIPTDGSVTSIGNYAFFGCSGLTNITIPTGVTSVGESAFFDCNGLMSISIPDSVTSIGKSAFSYCEGLTSITFNGTKAQWDAITKGSNWDSNTGRYTIRCTNEDIAES